VNLQSSKSKRGAKVESPGIRRPRSVVRLLPLVAGLLLVPVAFVTVPPARSVSATTAVRPVAPRPVTPRPVTPRPVTKTQASVSLGNPAADIAPSPNFLLDCSAMTYDDSSGCVDAVLSAVANGRTAEGLPVMVLPTDWTQLTPAEQLYVATNLERTVRGLPALSGMASALDAAAMVGAEQSNDPAPPAGFPWTQWGSNWAGAVGNPLEAIYYWMYDDGPGSSNVDCPRAGAPGCWGHRDNILLNLACHPCDMGTAYDATAYQGYPSWAEILVDTSGSPALDFSWSAVTPRLAGLAVHVPLAAPIVGIASTPDGHGYWEVAADGGIFSYGDASFYGSMGGKPLDRPIVGIASTPDGHGYWEVASDGGIFSFGDATFRGSTGGIALARPVVGMSATADGRGYWLVASDGGIFAYGDAAFHGSTGGDALVAPVVGMSSSKAGYWLTAADGGVFNFGVPFNGSMG
jgi:hypothetical protein